MEFYIYETICMYMYNLYTHILYYCDITITLQYSIILNINTVHYNNIKSQYYKLILLKINYIQGNVVILQCNERKRSFMLLKIFKILNGEKNYIFDCLNFSLFLHLLGKPQCGFMVTTGHF